MRRQEGDKQSPTPTVGVIAARAGPVALTADLAGRTQASEVAEVRPQVSGIVMARLFEEGSNVRAGQPLYQIDSRLYAASQQQASAALTNAQASVEASRLKAERYRVLAEEGGISKQDAADAIAAYNQARAQVALNRASLASANVNLGFTRITSPISGRIGRSAVTKGALVTSNQADALARCSGSIQSGSTSSNRAPISWRCAARWTPDASRRDRRRCASSCRTAANFRSRAS
jgi:membrane fusion protein (multidrug efflux system)